jgi:hypothetical protein
VSVSARRAKLLTKDEARRIAENIAKLPDSLTKRSAKWGFSLQIAKIAAASCQTEPFSE